MVGPIGHVLARVLITGSIGALAIAACTRTTDRVVEPVGGGDASTTSPEVSDAGTTPIGPIAPVEEPADDFRLVRAPEFGTTDRAWLARGQALQSGPAGGVGGGGASGMGGSDRRPVSSGGSWF